MAKAVNFIKDIFAAVVIAFFLTGCAALAPAPIVKTEYVSVPVVVPKAIARPKLETDNLKPGDGPDIVVRAYIITIKTLEEYSMELETQLNGLRVNK